MMIAHTSTTTLDQAARLLGWNGRIVEVTVLGTRIHVAGGVHDDEHERRSTAGRPPTADPLLLRCLLADDAGFADGPSPVRIDGAIAAGRNWRAALKPLGAFVAFGARAAVVPAKDAYSTHLATIAAVHGYGVIADHNMTAETSADGGLQVVHPPDQIPSAHRTWVHRLVEEVVYEAFITSRPVSHSATPGPMRVGRG